MSDRALYERDGSCFVATELTRGGWDPRHVNGATLLALLGHCLDDVATLTPMALARFTVDLARPVPVGERLEAVSEVVRQGKKLQVVQRLLVDGNEHTRSPALRLRIEDMSAAAASRARPQRSGRRTRSRFLKTRSACGRRTRPTPVSTRPWTSGVHAFGRVTARATGCE